jgi:hypothetical protein
LQMNESGGTTPATDDSGHWKYGVVVVLAGLAVILLAFFLALREYDRAAEVSTALAPITGVVGTIVGAYFGVQVGAAGREKAEAARAQSDRVAQSALSALSKDEAAAVMQSVR